MDQISLGDSQRDRAARPVARSLLVSVPAAPFFDPLRGWVDQSCVFDFDLAALARVEAWLRG